MRHDPGTWRRGHSRWTRHVIKEKSGARSDVNALTSTACLQHAMKFQASEKARLGVCTARHCELIIPVYFAARSAIQHFG
jgi:hypothetical protein